MAADQVRRRCFLGGRGLLLLLLLPACTLAYLHLGLAARDLVPGEGGLELARAFFSRAFSPALAAEARYVPDGSPPLLLTAARAALRTLLFAGASMSIALPLGLLFGFFAATSWWSADPDGAKSPQGRLLRRFVLPGLYVAVRLIIGLLRSIHEIIWALLFLAALGLSDLAAVLAIALPNAGILAKVFSEIVDEAPRHAAYALRSAGAAPAQVFLFGLLPRALPDLIAYAFYRFECAVRASAVLGFFGFSTLGYFIRQSFLASNYGEVWTFLYALLALVVAFDWWSGQVRRRLEPA